MHFGERMQVFCNVLPCRGHQISLLNKHTWDLNAHIHNSCKNKTNGKKFRELKSG